MAKANMVLPSGAKVTVEGTAEEVAQLLAKVSSPLPGTRSGRQARPAAAKASPVSAARARTRKGPTGHILDLRDENFFKTRRSLPDIQKKLEEKGHIYAQSSLSPVLVRLVRARELRRIKEKKGWIYVG